MWTLTCYLTPVHLFSRSDNKTRFLDVRDLSKTYIAGKWGILRKFEWKARMMVAYSRTQSVIARRFALHWVGTRHLSYFLNMKIFQILRQHGIVHGSVSLYLLIIYVSNSQCLWSNPRVSHLQRKSCTTEMHCPALYPDCKFQLCQLLSIWPPFHWPLFSSSQKMGWLDSVYRTRMFGDAFLTSENEERNQEAIVMSESRVYRTHSQARGMAPPF